MLIAEIFVLVEQAVAFLGTKGLQVRNNLSNLECVDMVRQGHRVVGPENLVIDSAVQPFSLKKGVPDGVLSLAVTAHQVEENFNRNASSAFSIYPAGISPVDGCTVAEREGS